MSQRFLLGHVPYDGGMTREWSANPLKISLDPMTRAIVKRLKKPLNVLIPDAQVEEAHVFNYKEKTKMVHVIKLNPDLAQHLGCF